MKSHNSPLASRDGCYQGMDFIFSEVHAYPRTIWAQKSEKQSTIAPKLIRMIPSMKLYRRGLQETMNREEPEVMRIT